MDRLKRELRDLPGALKAVGQLALIVLFLALVAGLILFGIAYEFLKVFAFWRIAFG